MRWWELLRHALDGAARAGVRSTLTALGVAIGCGALVAMVAFALGLQQQLERPFEQLGLLSDVHVQTRGADRRPASDAADASESKADREAASGRGNGTSPRLLDDAALEELRKIPGVKFAYPEMRLHNLRISRGERSTPSFAMSLPREMSLLSVADDMLVAGNFFSIDDAPEALIAEELLDDLGLADAQAAVGQEIDAAASGLAAEGEGRFQLTERRVKLRIVGVFKSPGLGLRGGAVLLPVDVMQGLPGVVESQIRRMRRNGSDAHEGYGRVIVRAESPGEVLAVEQAIQDKGFSTRTMLSNLEDARAFFLFLKILLGAVGTVALVIAGLGIANTLLMTVLERYQEIGVYKAIGATDGDVRLIFLYEAAALGLVGGLAGLALAGIVGWALQQGINAYMRHEGVRRSVDVFHFPWWLLVGALFFSVAVSVLSGLYPASRAARVDPIEALRRA